MGDVGAAGSPRCRGAGRLVWRQSGRTQAAASEQSGGGERLGKAEGGRLTCGARPLVAQEGAGVVLGRCRAPGPIWAEAGRGMPGCWAGLCGFWFLGCVEGLGIGLVWTGPGLGRETSHEFRVSG